MRTANVTLIDGLKIGETVHREAEIREAGVADLLDATSESEKLVRTPEGYHLIASSLMVGVNTLRRQIVKIGEYKGPLTLNEIKALSPVDLDLLQSKADELEKASMARIENRGRSEGGEG